MALHIDRAAARRKRRRGPGSHERQCRSGEETSPAPAAEGDAGGTGTLGALLPGALRQLERPPAPPAAAQDPAFGPRARHRSRRGPGGRRNADRPPDRPRPARRRALCPRAGALAAGARRSEEHTSELQSLMRISYAVFCLKKTKHTITTTL